MQRSEHPVRPSAHRPRNAEFWILLPLERRSRPNWTLSSDGNIFPCVPRRSAALLVALVRVFDFGKYLIAFRYLCRGICEWMPLLPQRADWPIPNTHAQHPMPNTQYPVLQTSETGGQPKNAPALSLFGPGVANREWGIANREFGPGQYQCVWHGLDLDWLAWDPGDWRCGYCQVLQLNSPWAERFTKEISNCYSHLETSMRASMYVWHSPDDDDDKFPARRLSGDCPAPTHNRAHGRRRGGRKYNRALVRV